MILCLKSRIFIDTWNGNIIIDDHIFDWQIKIVEKTIIKDRILKMGKYACNVQIFNKN